MVKKGKQGSTAGMLRQFDALKEKHPDALLLFRTGDFYEAYGKDAVKAAAILSVEITDRILPDRKLQVASFPVSELDSHLPKLIRSGVRVALCDQISDARKKADKQDKGQTISNDTDMARKKKTQQAQEEPAPTVKNTAGEKPAEKVQEAKAGNKQEEKATAEQKTDVAEKNRGKS